MKKKRKKTTHILLKITIILLALIISLNTSRNYSKVEIYLKDTLTSINRLITYPNQVLSKSVEPNQSESYIIQKNINISLENEIKELKELLELNSTLTEYKTENATVISRNNTYWLNALTIDKGSNSGLSEGMAVITTNGLIGKISKVSKTTSEVKLLTSNDITYKTSVVIRIDNKDYYAILNGYDQKTNLLKVSAIDKSIELKKGDTVLTSGLGEMPQGIYIGNVESTEIDQYNLSKIVYVKPSESFDNISYVTVLKEYNK